MPSIRVTLSIGIHNSSQEDTIEIDQEEWDNCKTDHDRQRLIDSHWKDWANNYIDGSADLIEE